jgi:NAD(P)-dependent dehydrogenase (short-subunit alcohol dehydrogenase family)
MTTRSGSRTSAEQALQGISLQGKVAIVTGANSGLGVETARVLALAGAEVVMACRTVDSGATVVSQLRSGLPAGMGTLTPQAVDLSDLASVRAFAQAFVASGKPLHLLINNAGVMAPPLSTTAQGFELQLGINHLGHFLLTQLLLPVLARSGPSRVVSVSSAIYRWGKGQRVLETLGTDPAFEKRSYSGFGQYSDSKLANILFTQGLAKRLPRSVSTFCLHPGVINTNLSRTMTGIVGGLYRTVGRLFMKTVAQGVATSVFGATAPELDGHSGAYLVDCHISRLTSEALDHSLAEKVWRLSEKCVSPHGSPL